MVKQASASTLTVVNAVKENLARFQAALPDDVKVSYEFDESPIVYRAIESVGVEGALGAGLTGLMVLLFLRDLRAVIIVVLNIPLALLGSIVLLDLTGNSINIMTLGGLALAIGILVDEATVEIENIHTQMEHTPSMSRAVRQGNMETAVPRLLALLCILSVFIPSFIMTGAVRALFVPLSLAVGGAMITSYLLSSTFVPVLSVWLLENRHGTHGHGKATGPRRGPGSSCGCRNGTGGSSPGRWRTGRRSCWPTCSPPVPSWSSSAVNWAASSSRGSTPGQFQLRVRPPQGTHYELTTQGGAEDAGCDRRGGRAEERRHHDGLRRGEPAAVHDQHGLSLEPRARTTACCGSGCARGAASISSRSRSGCARCCPRRSARGSARSCLRLGLTAEQADQRVADLIFAFEPGDLISETMSLGAPRRSRSSSAAGTWPTPAPTWTSSASSSTRSARCATCRSSSRSITRPSR